MGMLPGSEIFPSGPLQERRSSRRFEMRLPATVKTTDDAPFELNTETQNVSARGVFFYSDRPLEAGSSVEVTLTFPPHVSLTDAVRIRFLARVLRVERAPLAGIGVAAFIEEYEFLRSNPPGLSPDFSESN